MAPTVQQILTILDRLAPPTLAESWDNSGLMIGDPASPVRGILLGLDPTPGLLKEALTVGANLVITHHPIIFHPLKSIRINHPDGRFIETAIREQIHVVSCHTNLDSTVNGVSDVLADLLGLGDIAPLVPDNAGTTSCGLGRIGNYATPLSAAEFINRLKVTCSPPWLLEAGPRPDKINRAAVCGGSCSDLAEKALVAGAQVFVTAEVKHSAARWAEEAGLWLIDAGHFSTENPAVLSLAEQLKAETNSMYGEIDIRVSGQQAPPLTLVQE